GVPGARGHCLAVGREADGFDAARVPLELADLLAGARVPDPDGQVRPADGQCPPVGGERQTDRPTRLVEPTADALDGEREAQPPVLGGRWLFGDLLAEPSAFLATGDLPEPDGPVRILRGKGAAVRGEGEALDGLSGFELAQLLAGRRIEEDERVAGLVA